MTLEEFQPAMDRLHAVYPRAYPKERMDLVYRAMRYTSAAVWNETVNELIGDSMQPPSVSKMREVMYLVRKKFNEPGDPWEPLRQEIAGKVKASQCVKCAGSGALTAHKRNDPNQFEFTFGCDCEAGNLAMKLPENHGKIRQWNYQIAQEWRHAFESEPPQRPTREAARAAVRDLYRAGDMNSAIGFEPGPKRGSEADKWEADL